MKYCLLLLISISAYSFDQDHRDWNKVLNKYVERKGAQSYFNYKSLKKNVNELNKYLSELEKLDKKEFEKFNDNEKLAFWINAYNAYTVKIVIDNYPIDSIKDIGSIFSSTWSKSFINLFDRKYSLDDIEHKTIREQFKEARIHFAVNCASVGCPSLLNEAFVAKTLDSQLDKATLNFLNNKKKNYIKKNKLHLSKIFKWYGEDFVKYHGSVVSFVSKYLNLKHKNYEIKYTDYNWDLNEPK